LALLIADNKATADFSYSLQFPTSHNMSFSAFDTMTIEAMCGGFASPYMKTYSYGWNVIEASSTYIVAGGIGRNYQSMTVYFTGGIFDYTEFNVRAYNNGSMVDNQEVRITNGSPLWGQNTVPEPATMGLLIVGMLLTGTKRK
jgi:hypothetical protein